MSKILVTIEGGLVTSVASTEEDVEVMIIDQYVEGGADPDEYFATDEISNFVSGCHWHAINPHSGFSEVGIEVEDNKIKISK